MAIRMPHPVAFENGVYHLNVRVPADIASRVKGTHVTLSIDGRGTVVGVRDKVVVSLRTKDARVAKDRFTQVHAALDRHWRLVRSAPAPLTHKQAVAVAGLFYHQQVLAQERDHTLTPYVLQGERDALSAEAEAEEWRSRDPRKEWADLLRTKLAHCGEDAQGGFPPVTSPDGYMETDATSFTSAGPRRNTAAEAGSTSASMTGDPDLDARIMALLCRPDGDALLAYRGQADIDIDLVSISYEEALERLFGRATDKLCQRLALNVDEASRKRLLHEIGETYRQAESKLVRNMRGDYSADPVAARFPAFEPPDATGPTNLPAQGIETVSDLFERWSRKQAGKKGPATVRRYGLSLASLATFAGRRDWRTLTAADIFAWATKRHEVDGVSPDTVNRNDLVATSSGLG